MRGCYMSTLSLGHLLISISLATLSWLIIKSLVPHIWEPAQRHTLRLSKSISALRRTLDDPTSNRGEFATERALIDLEYVVFSIMKHSLAGEVGADNKEYARLLLLSQLVPKTALKSILLSAFSFHFSPTQLSKLLTTCCENDPDVMRASFLLRTTRLSADCTKNVHNFWRVFEQCKIGNFYMYVIEKERISFKYINPMED